MEHAILSLDPTDGVTAAHLPTIMRPLSAEITKVGVVKYFKCQLNLVIRLWTIYNNVMKGLLNYLEL